MKRAWVGLGGNVGDVRAYMVAALDALKRSDVVVELVSSLYETPPWGPVAQDRFLNSCVQVRTPLVPSDLLNRLHEVESSLRRERVQRWGPRTIDLDLLAYEGFVSVEPSLTVPHPRIADRAFVLVPLSEIAPDLRIDDVPVHELAQAVERGDMREVAKEWYVDP